VVATADGPVAVLAESVRDVLDVPAAQLEPLPYSRADAIDALANLGDRLVLVLAPDRLLAGYGVSRDRATRSCGRPAGGCVPARELRR